MFFVLNHFWQQSYKNAKICLHFARQDGQDGKTQKENRATKVTKIPKTKRRKYGMNEIIFDDQTIHMCTKWSSIPILIYLFRFEHFMK